MKTKDTTRKTGEHLFADCGGLPRCVTCGADEDDAYVGGEPCTFEATNTQHTPGAIRAAEVITQHKYGSPMKFGTEYGLKTTQGIADLIDRETAAPELLEALKTCELQLREYVQWHHEFEGGCSVEIEQAWIDAKSAIAKATKPV